MSKLIERINAYKSNKNLYTNLKDKIANLTPPINTRLTGYMLYLKQNNLDVKQAADKWKELDALAKQHYNELASKQPPINSRGLIDKHDYKLIRKIQFELLQEFKQQHPDKHPPTRLRPNIYPRHQRSPPNPWQLFLSEFKPSSTPDTQSTQQLFSNHLKQASQQWKNLNSDMKSRYLSQASINKSRHLIQQYKHNKQSNDSK